MSVLAETLREAEGVYNDPRVESLLAAFNDGRITMLKPLADPQKGIVYPEAEQVLGAGTDTKALLETLAKFGILQGRIDGRFVVCPYHSDRFDATVRYVCPKCGSRNLSKCFLYEHSRCGAIFYDYGLKSDGETLMCDKCKRAVPIGDQGFQRHGAWYECKLCSDKFASPKLRMYCSNQRHEFDPQESLFVDEVTYTLTANAQNKCTSEFDFTRPLKRMLQDAGYAVTAPGLVRGASGTVHQFDFIGARGDRKVVINFRGSGKDKGDDLVADMFMKVYDTQPGEPYLLTTTQLDTNSKRMAQVYGINVIEGTNPAEMLVRLMNTLTA